MYITQKHQVILHDILITLLKNKKWHEKKKKRNGMIKRKVLGNKVIKIHITLIHYVLGLTYIIKFKLQKNVTFLVCPLVKMDMCLNTAFECINSFA